MAEFKDMLKYFRERAGLSQSELAAKLGLSASTISMYEVGKRQPDFEKEELIADFFNVDLNTLRGKDIENLYSPKQRELMDKYERLTDQQREMVEKLLDSYLE